MRELLSWASIAPQVVEEPTRTRVLPTKQLCWLR